MRTQANSPGTDNRLFACLALNLPSRSLAPHLAQPHTRSVGCCSDVAPTERNLLRQARKIAHRSHIEVSSENGDPAAAPR